MKTLEPFEAISTGIRPPPEELLHFPERLSPGPSGEKRPEKSVRGFTFPVLHGAAIGQRDSRKGAQRQASAINGGNRRAGEDGRALRRRLFIPLPFRPRCN